MLFTVMDENKSWLLDKNIKQFCTDPDGAMKKKTDGGFVKSNKMYGINGRVFGNLEGLDLCLGDKISWHMVGIGTDTDVHGGNNLLTSVNSFTHRFLKLVTSSICCFFFFKFY